ncbi:MAG: radical SAM protein [Oscillospiraceae bacterium]|nr:radical SAM protein [Oscillospiraceae bacterium]
MKKYFRLHPYVKVIDGIKECALYNLFKGEVFSISKDEYRMLNDCENSIPLDEIENIDYKFISDLKDNGLGLDYETKMFVNKNIYGLPQVVNDVFKRVFLNKLFIEITNECNFNCEFCKNDNILFRKTGCKKWPSYNEKLSIEEWSEIISEAKNLGCKNFVIMGGEPFLKFKKLKEIVSLIIHFNNNDDIKIIVFTNGFLLDDEKILNYIKHNNITLCIQILADNDLTYEKISGNACVFSKVVFPTDKLKKTAVKYDLVILVSKFNENQIENIFKKFKDSNKKLEFIYPIKNKFYSEKYINLIYNRTKNFIKPSLPSFDRFSKYNNCYKNSIAISCDGLMYPCIMSRKLYLGNIRKVKLCEALIKSEDLGYSALCKDKIEGCKLCHKRYGCFDCRALEMSATNNLLGMEFCNLLHE